MSRKISIAKKLLISNVLYGLPVVVLMSLMITAKTKDISFAEHEIYGNEYQRSLESLLENISNHRLKVQRLIQGDAGSGAELQSLQGQVDGSFLAVEEVDKRLGQLLQFSEEGLKQRKRENLNLLLVKRKWESLKEAMREHKSKDIDDQHGAIIADIRGMIVHLGDTSNLVLDPDLDSYYLMDVTLMGLPQLQDRIQEISAFINGIMFRGRISGEERVQLSGYVALLQKMDLDRISASSQASLNEDINFYGVDENLQENIPKGLVELQTAVGVLVDLTKEIGGSDTIPISSEKYQVASAKAMAASYSYWGTCVNVLDRMLQMRIASLKKNRLWSIALGVLALAFASCVAWIIVAGLKKSLTETVLRLTEGVVLTNSTGRKLVNASQALSASSTEQAAAIQETVATLNEITAMVNRSVEHAATSADKTTASFQIACEGKEAVNQMRQAMLEIQGNIVDMTRHVEHSNKRIERIVQIINEIASKTQVINDIVFQTKLLSFNASVEAARAGEHGKGFAVVAEEVGNLAQMSGNAAKEIGGLLSRSLNDVEQIIKDSAQQMDVLVKKGGEKVQEGVGIANRCEEILRAVVEDMSDVKKLMEAISAAAKEEAEGVGNITIAMNEIDKTVHGNSDIAHETMGYSLTLSGQSSQLERIIHDLDMQLSGVTTHRKVSNSETDFTGDLIRTVGETTINHHHAGKHRQQQDHKNQAQKTAGREVLTPTGQYVDPMDPGFREDEAS